MNHKIIDIALKNRRKKWLKRVVALLCVLVMLFTMNTLKLRANTLMRRPTCGLKEHRHTQKCYDGDGNLTCGKIEHRHSDACYQESPVNVEGLEVETPDSVEPGDVLELDDTVNLDLNQSLDALPNLVSNDITQSAASRARTQAEYRLGEKAWLSAIIEKTGLQIDMSAITEVGVVDNDGSHGGLIESQKQNGDYIIRALKDFSEVELALVMTNEVETVRLTNGRAPVEVNFENEKETEVGNEQPPVTEDGQAAQPVVLDGGDVKSEDVKTADVNTEDEGSSKEDGTEEERTGNREQATGMAGENVPDVEGNIEGDQGVGLTTVPEQPADDQQGEGQDVDLTTMPEQPADDGDTTDETDSDDTQKPSPAGEGGAAQSDVTDEVSMDDQRGEGQGVDLTTVPEQPSEDQQGEGQDVDLTTVPEQPSEDQQGEGQDGDLTTVPEQPSDDQQGDGQDVDLTSVPEQPSEDQQGEGQGVDLTTVPEQPSEDQQGEGQDGDLTTVPEQPADDGDTTDETDSDDTQKPSPAGEGGVAQSAVTDEVPSDDQQGDGQDVALTSVPEQPADDQQGDGQDVDLTTVPEQPADDQQGDGQDVDLTTVPEQPSEDQQGEGQDGDLTTVPEQPADDQQGEGQGVDLTTVPEQPSDDGDTTDETDSDDTQKPSPGGEGVTAQSDVTDEVSTEGQAADAADEANPDEAEPAEGDAADEANPDEAEPAEGDNADEANPDEAEPAEGDAADEANPDASPAAYIDLSGEQDYPLSLRGLMAQANVSATAESVPASTEGETVPEGEDIPADTQEAPAAQAEELPASDWVIEYDETLFAVAPEGDDYTVMPLSSFDKATITVNGVPLTLANCRLPEDSAAQAPEEAETVYPAQHFEQTAAGMHVVVDAPEGAFPEGTTMVVRDVEDEQTLSNIEDTVSDEFVEVTRVHAVDISFWHDGVEIEPLVAISVMMSVPEVEEQEETVVVHVDDAGAAQVVDSQGEEQNGATGVAMEMPANGQNDEPTGESAESEGTETQSFEADNFSVYAVVVAKTIGTKYIDARGDAWNITVGYGKEANIPADATLRVSEVTSEAYLTQATEALDNGKRITEAYFFDIAILDTEGNEIQPDAPVQVNITLDEGAEAVSEAEDEHVVPVGDPAVCAMHFGDTETDVVKATETDESVAFDAASFSVWGVVYTVDFYYGNYEYHMPGDGHMTLSWLFDVLEIEADAAKAADVVFTDPELLAVRHIEQDTPLSTILAELGIADDAEDEPSDEAADGDGEDVKVAEDGEAEAKEKEDKIISAVDWLLVSLRPFDTEEKLTVTMEDGTVYEIRVEDDQKDDGTFKFYFHANEWGWKGSFAPSQNNGQLRIVENTRRYRDNDGTHLYSFAYKNNYTAYVPVVTENGSRFVYWLRDDGVSPSTEGGSWSGPGDNWPKDRNVHFGAYFAPDNAKLIVILPATNGTVSGGKAVNNRNDLPKYCYSNDDTTLKADCNWPYFFKGWYRQDGTLYSTYQELKASDFTEDVILKPVFETDFKYTVASNTLTHKAQDYQNGPVYNVTLQTGEFKIPDWSGWNNSPYNGNWVKPEVKGLWTEKVENAGVSSFEFDVQTRATSSNFTFAYWLKDDGTAPVTEGSTLLGFKKNGVVRDEFNGLDRDTTYIAFYRWNNDYIVRVNQASEGGRYRQDSAWHWLSGPRTVTVDGKSYFPYYFVNDHAVIVAEPASDEWYFDGWYNNGTERISTDATFDIHDYVYGNKDKGLPAHRGDYVLTPVFKRKVPYFNVWFDGTDGLGGGEVANNTLYARTNGKGEVGGSTSQYMKVNKTNYVPTDPNNVAYADIQLPTTAVAPQSQNLNGFTLQGWYEIYTGQYYQPGQQVRITADSVFYADWMPGSYDIGQNSNLAGAIDTNGFITTRVFDYNNLFNMPNIHLDLGQSIITQPTGAASMYNGQIKTDVPYSEYNKEYWYMNGTSDDFIFMGTVSGKGRSMNPFGREEKNQNRETSTNGTYFTAIPTQGLMSISGLKDRLFDTSDITPGKKYVGTANYLYSYDSRTGYYYYDSDKNAASYNQRARRFYVYNYTNKTNKSNGGDNTDFLPFNYGNREFNEGYSQPNYWFGMSSSIDFFLPNDVNGAVNSNTPVNISTHNREMVYKFAGDDDVWVYVDDQLVLDMGGIHGKIYGEINFSRGTWTIAYNGANKGVDSDGIMTYSGGSTLTGNINLAEGDHTLTLYYLERGISQSNCAIYFNIAPRYALQLYKVDSNTNEKLGGATFGVFTDEACTIAANVWESQTGNKTNVFTTASSGDDEGYAYCSGLVAGKTYYIKELTAPAGYPDVSEEVIKLVLDAQGNPTVSSSADRTNWTMATVTSSENTDEKGKFTLYITVKNSPETSITAQKIWAMIDGSNYSRDENCEVTVKLQRYTLSTTQNTGDTPNYTVRLISRHFAGSDGKPTNRDDGQVKVFAIRSETVPGGGSISFDVGATGNTGIYSVSAQYGGIQRNYTSYTTNRPFYINGGYANAAQAGSFTLSNVERNTDIYITYIGVAESADALGASIDKVNKTTGSGVSYQKIEDDDFNGQQDEVTLNRGNGWKYTWEKLDSTKGDQQCYYYVKEISSTSNLSTNPLLSNIPAYIQTTSSDGLSGGTISVRNTLNALKVKLNKRDKSSHNNLQGAQFKLYTKAEYEDPSFTAGKVSAIEDNAEIWLESDTYDNANQVFVSDGAGCFYTGYLPLGEYYLVETGAPEGYMLLYGPVRIQVTENGLMYQLHGEDSNTWHTQKLDSEGYYELYIDNEKTTSVEVQKTWTDTPPEGTYVVVQLYSSAELPEPTEPANPTNPTEPTNPSEPTEPTEPTEPATRNVNVSISWTGTPADNASVTVTAGDDVASCVLNRGNSWTGTLSDLTADTAYNLSFTVSNDGNATLVDAPASLAADGSDMISVNGIVKRDVPVRINWTGTPASGCQVVVSASDGTDTISASTWTKDGSVWSSTLPNMIVGKRYNVGFTVSNDSNASVTNIRDFTVGAGNAITTDGEVEEVPDEPTSRTVKVYTSKNNANGEVDNDWRIWLQLANTKYHVPGNNIYVNKDYTEANPYEDASTYPYGEKYYIYGWGIENASGTAERTDLEVTISARTEVSPANSLTYYMAMDDEEVSTIHFTVSNKTNTSSGTSSSTWQLKKYHSPYTQYASGSIGFAAGTSVKATIIFTNGHYPNREFKAVYNGVELNSTQDVYWTGAVNNSDYVNKRTVTFTVQDGAVLEIFANMNPEDLYQDITFERSSASAASPFQLASNIFMPVAYAEGESEDSFILPKPAGEGKPNLSGMHAYGDPVILSGSDIQEWYHKWSNLPTVDEAGNPVHYCVAETEVHIVNAKDVTATYTTTTHEDGSLTVNIVNTVTEWPKGDLSLTKTVFGKTDDTTAFNFEIQLTAPTGVTLESSYRAAHTGDESVTSVSVDDTGKITGIQLKQDDKITIYDLPEGTRYVITETGDYAGFSQGTANNTSGTIQARTEAQAAIQNVFTANGELIFKANKNFVNGVLGDHRFTFTLTQVKAVNDPTQADANEKLSAPVSLTTSAASGQTQTLSFDSISFNENDVDKTFYFMIDETVPDLDADGVNNHVKYDTSKHYFTVEVTLKGSELVITKTPSLSGDEQDTAKFTNKQLGKLTVTKTFDGKAKLTDDEKNAVKFTVSGPAGFTAVTKTYAEFEEVDGVPTWTLDNIPLGTYTVAESNMAIGNYLRISTVAVDGGDPTAATTATVVLTAADIDREIAFTNTYTPRPGSLEISKEILAGTTSAGKHFVFKVELKDDEGADFSGNVKLTDVNHSAEIVEVTDGTLYVIVFKDGKALIDDLPAGTTYLVTEVLDRNDLPDAIRDAIPNEGDIDEENWEQWQDTEYGDTTKTIEALDKDAVTVTNTRLGFMTVRKAIRGTDGTGIALDPMPEFPIEITTVINDRTYYVDVELDEDGSTLWGKLVTEAPDPALTVTAGSEMTILALPYSTYTVTEANPGNVEVAEYQFVEVDSTTTDTVTLNGSNNSDEVDLINKYRIGSVEVDKTFVGLDAGTLPMDFEITAAWGTATNASTCVLPMAVKEGYTDPDEAGAEMVVNGAVIRGPYTKETRPSLNADYYWKIDNLPLGAVVTFTEVYGAVPGKSWTATVTDATNSTRTVINGTSDISGTATAATSGMRKVSFTNEYAPSGLTLRKVVEADTNLPVDGKLSYTNGDYTFKVTGPSGDDSQTYTVVITMEDGVMKSATLNGTQITPENEATLHAVFDDVNGVRLMNLAEGTYTVTEDSWSIAKPDKSDMFLKRIDIIRGAVGSTVDETERKATVVISNDPATGSPSVEMVYTNVLESNEPNLEKQVTNLNDSEDMPDADFASESPWNKSADYDIGDQVPYRITTFIPSGYYRAQGDRYIYLIHDTMNHLEYVGATGALVDQEGNYTGSGRMYAFVKSDTDGDTGAWYDVSKWFFVTEQLYNDGKQTITIHPTTLNNLKTVIDGYRVTNWGADTHGDKYPYKAPELSDELTENINADIRYLQFRYRATLMPDAEIGPGVGNPNKAKLEYTNGSNSTAFTDEDTNIVYTYKLVVNKQDENGVALTGAKFQLFKKYLNAPLHSGTPRQFGNVTFHDLDSSVISVDTSRLTSANTSICGNYYLVTPTSPAAGTESSQYVWNGIDDGWYILVETKAPNGYRALAEPMAINIDTTLKTSVAGFTSGYANVYPEYDEEHPELFSATGCFVTDSGNSRLIGGTVTANIPNTPYPGIEILKINEQTRNNDKPSVLAGAEFTIERWDGSSYIPYAPATTVSQSGTGDSEQSGTKAVTDAQGVAVFPQIEPGEYRIRETKVPDGFVKLLANNIYFNVEDEGGSRTITRYKTPMKIVSNSGGIAVTKPRDDADKITDNNLSDGSTFYVTFDGNDTFTVGNEPGAALPSTGGSGTALYYIAGSALLLLALALLLRRRRDEA